MAVSDEKLQKFEDAVMEQANAKAENILADLNAKKEQTLSQTEDEELTRHFTNMQNEISQIKQSCIKRVSLHAQQANKEMLLYREGISEKVFGAVRKRLVEFTKTADYEKFLSDEIKRLKDYAADDLVVCVSENDLKFKDTVFASMTVVADKRIEIGGFILKSDEKGFALDETLDARLESQKEYFNTVSDLKV